MSPYHWSIPTWPGLHIAKSIFTEGDFHVIYFPGNKHTSTTFISSDD